MPNSCQSKKCGVFMVFGSELSKTTTKVLVYSLHRRTSIEEDEQDPVGVMDGTKWGGFQQLIRICCNVGSSKSLVPPFGSPERPMPDVIPRIAESF
ncbi:hypothetical protein Tco_0735598 [Tanacetum coccineum]